MKTSTSVNTGQPVSASYGAGYFDGMTYNLKDIIIVMFMLMLGTEFTDTLTLGEGIVITKQSIGVASDSSQFSSVDGILGIGPVDLTLNTLLKEQTTTIPTVTDNLYHQGTISENIVSISFEPATSPVVTNGELTFGGTDSTKHTGSIAYT